MNIENLYLYSFEYMNKPHESLNKQYNLITKATIDDRFLNTIFESFIKSIAPLQEQIEKDDILLGYELNIDKINSNYINLKNIYYYNNSISLWNGIKPNIKTKIDNNNTIQVCTISNIEEHLRSREKIQAADSVIEEDEFGSKTQLSPITSHKNYVANSNTSSIDFDHLQVSENLLGNNNKFYISDLISYNLKYSETVGIGKTLPVGIFLLFNLLEENEMKYLLPDEDTIVKFKIPNIQKTHHYLTQVLSTSIKQSKPITLFEYNSYYQTNIEKYQYIDHRLNQIITTPIQGDSSCFYFYLNFIKKSITSIGQKELKISEMFYILKDPIYNLEIAEKTLQYFNTEQKILLIKTKATLIEISDTEKDNYYYVSKNDPLSLDIEDKIIIFLKKEIKEEKILDSTNILLNNIIYQKNIYQYCSENQYNIYKYKANQYQQLSIIEYTYETIELKDLVNRLIIVK